MIRDYYERSASRIAREFGALDHHPDLVVEPRETVGGADDEILGDGRVEDALLAEFLLQALRYVEDPALLLVGHVLAPDEGIGIEPELFLEGLVQGRDDTDGVAAFLVGAIRVLVRDPTLRDHEIVDAGGIRIRRGHGLFVGGEVAGLVVDLDGLEFLFTEAVLQAVGPEPGQGILRLGLGALRVIPVELVAVGIGVAADAHAGGVDHGRSLARADVGQGFFHGAHGIREVEAIALDDLQVGTR